MPKGNEYKVRVRGRIAVQRADCIRPVLRAAVVLLAATTTGCATLNVSSHVQRGTDFTQYRTFGWGPADALPTGDPRLDENPYFRDYTEGAVEREMAGRGYGQLDSGTPDLLIHYHANVSRRIDVDRLDRSYGYCYQGDCQVRLRDFEAGTLVLDIVDARTKRVVWRGWAQHGVADILGDNERMARRINDAVARMLARLPAGGERPVRSVATGGKR